MRLHRLMSLPVLMLLALAISCTSAGRHLGQVGTPAATPEDQATIVVFVRGVANAVGSLNTELYQDDRNLGTVRPGEYVVWNTALPSDGPLLIAIKGFQNDHLPIRPEPGETVYLLAESRANMVGPSLRLSRLDEAAGEELLGKHAKRGEVSSVGR